MADEKVRVLVFARCESQRHRCEGAQPRIERVLAGRESVPRRIGTAQQVGQEQACPLAQEMTPPQRLQPSGDRPQTE